MTFKVGRESLIPISNLKNKAKEAELKNYDYNQDNVLDASEMGRYYADRADGEAPISTADIYRVAGGRQHKVKAFYRDYYQTLYTYAPEARGNFNLPGLGAGNVRTGRQLISDKQDAYNFLIDCDLMDKKFIEQGVESAEIVIGPKGFKKDAGSDIDEMVTIPMNVATAEGYRTFDRAGGSHWVPEKKFLAASVDVASLRTLCGKESGLEFYIRVQTTEGKTLFVNKDGQAFNNFEISASELKKRGTP